MLISVFLTGILATCAVDPGLTQSSVDQTYEPEPQDCHAVNWAEAISSKRPAKDAACQRAERRVDIPPVTLQRTVTNLGDYDSRQSYIDPEHEDLVSTVAPRADRLLNIDGRETAVSSGRLGTRLSVGFSEDRLAVRFLGDTTESVKIPIVEEQMVARAPQQPGRASDEPQSTTPHALPVMSSALTYLAWSAVVSILLAAGVALNR
jgi:hypothetical protein